MSLQWTSLLLLMAITSDIVFSAPTLPGTDETSCSLLQQYINKKYPLTDPILMPDGSVKFRIAIISDLDGASVSPKEANKWLSHFKQGYLSYNVQSKAVSVEWDAAGAGNDSVVFETDLSKNGRGLELSELVTFNGQLITLDDKTGLVYVFDNNVLIPWVIVVEGDGHQKDAMKNEWATVKDSKLYVGSHGREMADRNGHLSKKSYATMWVKTIDQNGGVKHLDWADNFKKVRAAGGIQYPGYMTHEACVWSDVHGRWFFLPRKASQEQYNYKEDEKKGTNMLLMATPDFNDVQVKRIGEIIPNRGYASFKFVPGTNDTVITAICTTEEGKETATYLSVFTIDGDIIYPQTKVSDMKFEGFEFI